MPGSVWNCLWGHALKRSHRINRKSRVSYPGPGFLFSASWPLLPKKHYNGLINHPTSNCYRHYRRNKTKFNKHRPIMLMQLVNNWDYHMSTAPNKQCCHSITMLYYSKTCVFYDPTTTGGPFSEGSYLSAGDSVGIFYALTDRAAKWIKSKIPWLKM